MSKNHEPQRKKQILIEHVVKQLIQNQPHKYTRKTALPEAKKRVAIALAESKRQEAVNRRQAITQPGLDSITLNPVKGGVTLE